MTYSRRKQKAIKNKLEKLMFIVVIIASLALYVDFVRFPECYINTWRYQLKNDIKAGNQEMIDYYNNVYVKHNRVLFK